MPSAEHEADVQQSRRLSGTEGGVLQTAAQDAESSLGPKAELCECPRQVIDPRVNCDEKDGCAELFIVDEGEAAGKHMNK